MIKSLKSSLSIACLFVVSFGLSSCTEKDLTTTTALKSIQEYLNYKPQYETATLDLGQVKWRTIKDSVQINKYKKLAEEGYIEFDSHSLKKKWLSKDSIWNVSFRLTDKANAYVVDQKNQKVTVKTIVYSVNEDKPIEIHNKNKKSASITVMLSKNPTPFAQLGKDKTPNIGFITKKYKLMFNEESGWEVAP